MKTKPKTIHVAALNAIFVFSRNTGPHFVLDIQDEVPALEAGGQTDFCKQQNYMGILKLTSTKRKVRGKVIENAIICDSFLRIHEEL